MKLKQVFHLSPFICIASCQIVYSQSFNFSINNYPPSSYENDHFATSTENTDIVQDNNGLIYLCNSSGLLVYDGVKWELIPGTETLKLYALAKDENGIIYGAGNNYGYVTFNSNGRARWNSIDSAFKNQITSFGVFDIVCLKGIAYLISRREIYTWNGKTGDTIPANNIAASLIFNNTLFFYQDGEYLSTNNTWKADSSKRGFYFIDGDTLKKSSELNFDFLIRTFFKDEKNNTVCEYFANSKNELCRFKNQQVTTLTSNMFLEKDDDITAGILYPNRELAIGTAKSGLYILDSAGRVKEHINNKLGLLGTYVIDLYLDHQDGLWAITEGGVSRIEYPRPVKIITPALGLSGNAFKVLVDSSRLLIATSNGIFKSDLKTADKIFRSNVTVARDETRDILRVNQDFLTACSDGPGYYIEQDNGATSTGTGNDTPAYSILTSNIFDSVFFAGGIGSIKVYKYWRKVISTEFYNGRQIRWDSLKEIKINKDTIRSIAEAPDKKLWLANHYVGYVDFSNGIASADSVRYFHSDAGVETKSGLTYKVHCIKGTVYLTCKNGILKFNESKHRFEPDCSFGKLFCDGRHLCSDIVLDSAGNFWAASKSTAGKCVQQNGNVIWDTIPFSCIPIGAHINSLYVDYRNDVWAATDKGVYGYDQNVPFDFSKPFKTLIRKFKINSDSTVYFGYASDVSKTLGGIVIPFVTHNIAIDYAATDFTNPKKLLYSYVLEGRDNTWSTWTNETSKYYDGLWEGHYTFRVKSKNIYGTVSSVASYEFTVLPPWYRTWWAYISYLILAVLIVYLIVRLNQRRLIIDKKNLEEKVNDRTLELKGAQLQLIQSEKMASLGQLTAGVAHEINNPINFVSGSINPLKRDIGEIMRLLEIYSSLNHSNYSSKLDEILKYRDQIDLNFTIDEIESLINGIEQGSKRTAEIVKGLRSFSRFDEEDMKRASINECIESTLVLLQNKLEKQSIELIKSLGSLPAIECYPGELNQVFLNIFTNAIEALGSDGKIFITTTSENNHIKISIRDTGTGMSDEVKKKLFDPFFTTKDVGKGTGLGLSISYGIIEKHSGKIEVKSEIGKGTEFTVVLPIQQL